MKILLVNSLYSPNIVGGAELSVQILAEGFRAAGIEPVVLSTSDRAGRGEVAGVKVYYVRTPNLYWMKNAREHPQALRFVWHLLDARNPFVGGILREIIGYEEPDLVHTHNLAGWSTQTWSLVKGLNLPLVHTLRDHYLLCNRSTMYKNGALCHEPCRSCACLSWPKRQASGQVDAVIGLSHFILNRHTSHGFFARALHRVQIPNPVTSGAAIRRAPSGDRVTAFGYVGSLAPHKGVELLLKEFSQGPDTTAELHLYGTGYTKDYHAELVARYASERIRFWGWKPVAEVFSKIDVLVVPSLCQEAFGRVVVEAYASGIPVIASDRGGLTELVDADRTGLLFNPDHDGELADRIEAFVGDRERTANLASNCLKKAEGYTAATVVERHANLYDAVLT